MLVNSLQELARKNLKIQDVFLSIEETPIAAASIGQVHRGVLKNGYVPNILSTNTRSQRAHITDNFATSPISYSGTR